MSSNIALDEKLIDEARKVGRHRTRRAAVTAALKEYVKYRKQLAILDLAGNVDLDPAYDHKTQRRRKR